MSSAKKTEQAVRRIALSFPEVSEGVVCQRASFEAGKKRFLFLEGTQDSCLVMLKLHDSLAEASKLAAASPECYRVGGIGWVTVTFSARESPPPGLLERWIEESYRLLVPKKLAAQLLESRESRPHLQSPLGNRSQNASPHRVSRGMFPMTPREFRKTALSFSEAVELSHMGHPDFRVRGKIFSTLGPDEDWGMAKLTPEQQAPLVQDQPAVFQPASGAWGRRGCTIIQLKKADKRLVRQALLFAWRNTAPKKLVQEYDGEFTP